MVGCPPRALLRAVDYDDEEEVNLLYVAMTRAESACFVESRTAEWLAYAGVQLEDVQVHPPPVPHAELTGAVPGARQGVEVSGLFEGETGGVDRRGGRRRAARVVVGPARPLHHRAVVRLEIDARAAGERVDGLRHRVEVGRRAVARLDMRVRPQPARAL